ncbi:MAG: hypothetical protein NXI04_15910 [Planctomycetaceae bacterium]|nr:hypothetical protein [Planctomycetaceae bacterium]
MGVFKKLFRRADKKFSREEYLETMRSVAEPIAAATGDPVAEVIQALATTNVQTHLIDRVVELRQQNDELQKRLKVRDAQLSELNEHFEGTA